MSDLNINFPKEVYFINGVGRARLYGSVAAVKLSIRSRRWSQGYSGITVWQKDSLGWFEVTRQFIDPDGRLTW